MPQSTVRAGATEEGDWETSIANTRASNWELVKRDDRKMNRTLTQEQIDFFYLNGYLHIPQLIPPEELEPVQRDTAEMINRGIEVEVDDPTYLYGFDATDNDRRCLYRINNLIKHHGNASFSLLLAYPKLLDAASQVVQDDYFVSSVHSIVFKISERGYPVPWHQDPVPIYQYPVFNVDIYLDEATPENGCLYVIPKTHLSGYHGKREFIAAWTEGKEIDAPGAIPIITQPGDVIFHNTSVIHGSFWNRSNSLRRTIYFHIDHYQDVKKRPPDDRQRTAYLECQKITQEAIALRQREFPAEAAFNYNLVDEDMLAAKGLRGP